MVNNINVLAYKFAEVLRNSGNDILNQPNTYNIPNSITLTNNLWNSSIKKNKEYEGMLKSPYSDLLPHVVGRNR
jgi:hypothetical protein